MPFQIPVDEEIVTWEWKFMDCDDNLIQTLPAYILDIECSKDGGTATFDGRFLNEILNNQDCDKRHYLQVTLNGVDYFSEQFCCCSRFDVDENDCQPLLNIECPFADCMDEVLTLLPPFEIEIENLGNNQINLGIDFTPIANYLISFGATIITNFTVTYQGGSPIYNLFSAGNTSPVALGSRNTASIDFDYECDGEVYTYNLFADFRIENNQILPPVDREPIILNRFINSIISQSDCILLVANNRLINSPILNQSFCIVDGTSETLISNGIKHKLCLTDYASPITIKRKVETIYSVCEQSFELDFDLPNPCRNTIITPL